MNRISDRVKIIYLIVFIFFITGFGLFWMDSIGFLDLGGVIRPFKEDAPSVTEALDDEPSLIEREEFEKQKQKLAERIEKLDSREAVISEKEKELDAENEKLAEIRKGLELEKKKFAQDRKRYSGYMENVKKLAKKISDMPPEESVKIMVRWEDPLIIDVLRQMDADAEEAGRASITSYLITLMPKEKASRIMYLMTQL